MGFARAAGVPAILVGDIDLGGVFASFVGTLAVLPSDQELIAGFVVNKFRGDRALSPAWPCSSSSPVVPHWECCPS